MNDKSYAVVNVSNNYDKTITAVSYVYLLPPDPIN